jgi:hypothetical protein
MEYEAGRWYVLRKNMRVKKEGGNILYAEGVFGAEV